MLERGPEVRTQTVRLRQTDGRPTLEEMHRIEGVARDVAGEPVANAWVVLEETAWSSSGPDGRFRFDHLAPGTYRCFVRAPDGSETRAEVTVPGDTLDLTVGKRTRARRKSR